MTTKQIGNIGESKTLYEFVRRGIPVYIPFGDNESADLIADFNGKLNKVQVKTTEYEKTDGTIEFNVAKRPTGAGERIRYVDGQVDYFALYSATINDVFLIPFAKVRGRSTFSLRYKNQTSKSNNSQDYKFDSIIGNSHQ